MIIDLTLIQMFCALLISVVVVGILEYSKVGHAKQVVKSSLHMIVQLFIIGFVLQYIMNMTNSTLGSLYIFIMLGFAYRTLAIQIKGVNSNIRKCAFIALPMGTLAMLGYMILVVVRPNPTIDPQYIIPLYGMILGNTLNGLVLAIRSLIRELEVENAHIMTLIDMGVSPTVAVRSAISNSLVVAILPLLTSMLGMGLISLPGLMTGQILGGVSPLIAVKYQIAMIFGIFGSVTLTTLLFLTLISHRLINKHDQYIGLK